MMGGEMLFHALQYNGTPEQMFSFCRGRKDARTMAGWPEIFIFPKKNVGADRGEWVVFDSNGTLRIYQDRYFREMFQHVEGDAYRSKPEPQSGITAPANPETPSKLE